MKERRVEREQDVHPKKSEAIYKEQEKKHASYNCKLLKKGEKNMKIDYLINKYFEGESTCEEERQIRLFFKQENVPSHLEEYRDFFSFFDEESQLHATEIEEIAIAHKPKRLTNRYFRYGMIGIAASLILTLSIIGMNKYFDIPQNYV